MVWVVVAVPLLAAGTAFVVRFIVGDRSRGRLRCPRCWYDMEGGGEKCPECGRVVRSARELGRSRRRKRWAVAGVVLLVLGGASLATRQAVVHGAVSLVPDWVLVAGMERWPAGSGLYAELKQRQWDGELRRASQRRMIRKSARLIAEPREALVLERAAYALQIAEFLGQDEAERHTRPWGTWVSVSDVMDVRPVVLDLAELIGHADQQVWARGAAAMPSFEPESALAFPMLFVRDPTGGTAGTGGTSPASSLLDRARRPYLGIREIIGWRSGSTVVLPPVREALESWADAGRDLGELRARLADSLGADAEEVRLLAMWLVRSGFWPDDALRLRVLPMYDPESSVTAAAVVDFAVSGPLDEPAQAVIREALATRDYEQWAWAVERLGERGAEAAVLAEDLREMLGTYKAQVSAVPYFLISGDGETAARALMRSISQEDQLGDAIHIVKLGRIGWVDDEVLMMLRNRLDSELANNRLAAAAVLLRLGTPEGFDRAELTRIAAQGAVEQFGGLNMTWFGDAVQYGEADYPTVIEV